MKEAKGKTSKTPTLAQRKKRAEAQTKAATEYEPQMVSIASTTGSATSGSRRNRAATITRTDRFKNIDDGMIPFQSSISKGKNSGNISIQDVVLLCQKAYYNFAVFRNTIDLMTEFSSSSIILKGGNVKSRKFFKSFFKKIGLLSLTERFFREFFRSGNVFISRFDADIKPNDMIKINSAFGGEAIATMLPVRYCILNPSEIEMEGTVSFSQGNYFKVLSAYELERLRSPRTEEDQQILDSLGADFAKKIKDKKTGTVLIPLDPSKVVAVFYKKQDYEPFAIPMGYPVLDDINWKAELKKMDMAITRTMQQAILLVTMGAEPEKGGVSQRHIDAMRTFFENESVGRVLIADYTTEAKFVLPDISSLLDPKKYEVVDRDIRLGLNNILFGDGGSGEKFSAQMIKVQIFLERLKQAREAFLDDFLIPEMKRVSKDLGFKNIPTPKFEEVSLRDDVEHKKLYTRLMEAGILTPEEGLQAFENGELPTPESSLESQRQFKDSKGEGLYEPIVGGPFSQMEQTKVQGEQKSEQAKQVKLNKPAGRPAGSKAPQTKKNPAPAGASVNFSVSAIAKTLSSASKLEKEVEKFSRKKFGVGGKKLTESQREVIKTLSDLIVANEDLDNWVSSIELYANSPADTNADRVKEIDRLACEHQVDHFLASILYHSSVDAQD